LILLPNAPRAELPRTGLLCPKCEAAD
jgi:hypothetical protein